MRIKLRILLTALLIMTSCNFYMYAQETNPGKTYNYDSLKNQGKNFIGGKIINGDTVLHMNIEEITIIPPYNFKSNWQRRRYSRLVRYVKKVYPYSQVVKRKFYNMERALDTIEGKRARKKFIKRKERELKKEFKNELKKLTILQGRILMKLVDRETGHTTYDVLKEYKGNLSAIFWQSVARVFGSNLKEGYQPKTDDRMIEHIITRIENGQL